MPLTQDIEVKQGTAFVKEKAYYPPVPVGEYQVEVASIDMTNEETYASKMAKNQDKDKEYEQILKVKLRILDPGPYYGKLLFMRNMTVRFCLPSKKAGSKLSSLFCFVKAIEAGKKDGVHEWTEESIANFGHRLRNNLNAYEGQEVTENGITYRTGGAQLMVTSNIYRIESGDHAGKKANGSVKADSCAPIENFTYLPKFVMPAREVDPIFKQDNPEATCDFLINGKEKCTEVIHGWVANKGVKDKEKIVTQEDWIEAQEAKYDGNSYCSLHYPIIKKEFGSAILTSLNTF